MTSPPRPLTLDDAPRILELEHELFGPGAWSPWMVQDELSAPGRTYLGIDDDGGPGPGGDASPGVLVAYGGSWFDGVDAQIMTLGVARSHQGRGLGRLLLDALLAGERARGAKHVFLEVRVDNQPAIAMYERAGFERLGVRRGYYQPENVDALTMRLALRPV